MNIHLQVDIYSHNFVCKAITPRGNSLCEMFARTFIQWGVKHERGRYFRQAVKVYATKTADSVEYRFHINAYNAFLDHLQLNQIDIDKHVKVNIIPLPKITNISMLVKDTFKPRDYQVPAIEYLSSDAKNKLVSAQPGAGKGAMTLFSISNLSMITAIIVRPQFMGKWRDEILEKCDISPEEIVLVQGSPQLLKLLELAKYDKLDCKYIIISNKTIQMWYKQYEKFREDTYDLGYECLPHELYTLLKAGIRVVDEVHLDLHLQCKIDLYTHIHHSISLSATLLSDDPFIRKMQELLYPLKDRFDSGAVEKYVDSFGVTYALETMNNIMTSEFGSVNYSHTAYEKSLMKNKPRLVNYLKMIDWLIKDSFFKVQRKEKKLLVYAGSVMMCTIMTNYFKEKYSHLDIRRYCEDDPYENLLDPDIRFTTLISSGVGHDVKNLVIVINTVALSSSQSNIQALGRLRRLPDGHPVSYYFLSCKDIPKHMQYHKAKEDLFRTRVKSYSLLQPGFRI